MKEMNFSEIYEWFKENIKKYAETISNATGIKYLIIKLKISHKENIVKRFRCFYRNDC